MTIIIYLIGIMILGLGFRVRDWVKGGPHDYGQRVSRLAGKGGRGLHVISRAAGTSFHVSTYVSRGDCCVHKAIPLTSHIS
jgi:hypothetical protein